MKNILIILLLALPTLVFSQPQTALNTTAANNYRDSDKALNYVYRSVLKAQAKDAAFIKAIKASQKSWIAFRDAEMLAKFPHKDEAMYYGSMFGLEWNSALKELTDKRTKELKAYLKAEL
jgi:uncharacterized protein YecT (DUF1311 family)